MTPLRTREELEAALVSDLTETALVGGAVLAAIVALAVVHHYWQRWRAGRRGSEWAVKIHALLAEGRSQWSLSKTSAIVHGRTAIRIAVHVHSVSVYVERDGVYENVDHALTFRERKQLYPLAARMEREFKAEKAEGWRLQALKTLGEALP